MEKIFSFIEHIHHSFGILGDIAMCIFLAIIVLGCYIVWMMVWEANEWYKQEGWKRNW